MTKDEIEKIKNDRLKEVKDKYKGADCGTPSLNDELKIELEYQKMLYENGFESIYKPGSKLWDSIKE